MDHLVDEIFTDRAWPSCRSVEAAADREQFLREGQRLDARAAAGSRDDAPHDQASNDGESPDDRSPAGAASARIALSRTASTSAAPRPAVCSFNVRSPATPGIFAHSPSDPSPRATPTPG